MSDTRIRVATIADIGVLIRHRRMMWWDMGRRDETALAALEEAAREYFSIAILDGSYRGFLAIGDGDKVIGGGGIVISPWPGVVGQRQPRRAMIMNMYVEREHRRRGVARALMQEMISWCRNNNFSFVGLHASDEARPLYEQLGFKPTSEMQLDLKAGGID